MDDLMGRSFAHKISRLGITIDSSTCKKASINGWFRDGMLRVESRNIPIIDGYVSHGWAFSRAESPRQ